MAVLPDTFGNYERRMRIKSAKHFQACFLTINEPVLLFLFERMPTHHRPAFGVECAGEDDFHFLLFGPAFLIGGQTEIAIGDERDLFGFARSRFFHSDCRYPNHFPAPSLCKTERLLGDRPGAPTFVDARSVCDPSG